LERSTDGQRFSTIGTVDPLASSAYTYIDKTAATGVGYYYRLKMIDNDNSFKYSGTILIRAAKEAFDVLLYPNPAVNEIKAGLFLDKQTRCNIQLINAAGELIRAATPLFEKGYNLYTINVTTLPAGEYTVILSAGGSKTAKSFFKN
jgi:hypothetical protein